MDALYITLEEFLAVNVTHVRFCGRSIVTWFVFGRASENWKGQLVFPGFYGHA